MTEEKTRQRRPIKDTIGFIQHGLIPEEDAIYDAPSPYPDPAHRYLRGLNRCGTMSGACKLAGIGVKRVYEWRKQLEGFQEEEETAKDCLLDVEEQSLFSLGLNAKNEHARVKALNNILKANRP